MKARNLQADPRCVVHLEGGDDVVMVRGTMAPVSDPELIASLLAASRSSTPSPTTGRTCRSAHPERSCWRCRPRPR